MEHLSRTFGHNDVDPATRRARVRAVFDHIARRYDLMNDLMSGFMHRGWKARFAGGVAAPVAGPIVDLAGGTGDIAERLMARLPGQPVMVCDPSTAMLGVASGRLGAAAPLVAAEGERLPFGDAMVGAVTLSFGLRNMTEPTRAIAEIFRVLRPGGQLHILEFSQPDRWFELPYRLYSRITIPLLGAMIARDRDAYRYLVDSIEIFPSAQAVSASLTDAGFVDVAVEKLMFGVAAIHVARKPAE
ncbi:MAG: ubiquinone/menaquinone biosynthesis methyltransferase [Hyphomicrobiales bacterium]